MLIGTYSIPLLCRRLHQRHSLRSHVGLRPPRNDTVIEAQLRRLSLLG